MQEDPKPTSRKKFLLWGAITACSVTLLKFLPKIKAQKQPTIKMLSEDGTLVEIDEKLFVSTGKKVTDQELQQWVKKNN